MEKGGTTATGEELDVAMKDGDGREVRRSSGSQNEPAIQVICLVRPLTRSL